MISKKLKAILLLSFLSFIILIFPNFGYAIEKFEKGDAVYSDLGEGHHLFGFIGHAGLYMWWDKTDDLGNYQSPTEEEYHAVYQSPAQCPARC